MQARKSERATLTTHDVRHERLRNLFSVLSSSDSLRVFELAAQGIIPSKMTFDKIKLSRAQYYRKIKQLSDLGLVSEDENEKGVYRHTPLGEIVYQNHVVTLKRIALDNNMMEVVAKFILKNKSPNESFRSAMKQVTRELIEGTDPALSSLGNLRLCENIDEYQSLVSRLVRETKADLRLAIRNLDLGVIQALLDSAERGVRIEMIYTGWKGFHSNMNVDPLEELLTSARRSYPRATQSIHSNPNFSIKRTNIRYGFLVSDNAKIAIEIADPDDIQSFFAGVILESRDLAPKLVSFFERSFETAKSVSLND